MDRSSNHVVQIGEARNGWGPWVLDIWASRGLLYFLAWRDIKVRYKQTVLGAAWAVLQPLLLMLIFTFVLGRATHLAPQWRPYSVYAYAGLIVWQLFSFGLNGASESLVTNERLVTRVYFPRAVIPVSAVLAGVLDFIVSFVVLLALMLMYHVAVPARILLAPLAVGLAVLTALSVGLWLAALNVRYRDVRYTLGFANQFLLFATPIAYSSSAVPVRWHFLYGLNPLSSVVEIFRWCMLGAAAPSTSLLIASATSLVALLASGVWYFRRVEHHFADII